MNEREELYAAIYSQEEVYRPPSEENSTLLEVASGCSWGRCAFCDFIRDPFYLHKEEDIEFQLKALRQLEPGSGRIFFLGQNAFCLETSALLSIMEKARRLMPSVKEFAMYARADDILRKDPEALRRLREAGLRDLHVGVESGSDSILSMVNKGCTAHEIQEALSMLDKASIGYYVTIILGLGGRPYRNLHAVETARLLSALHPKQIWALALKLWPDTPLAKQAERGEFEPMTPREILLEERILLENLTVADTFYMDTTALNLYTIQGRLPDQKQALLQAIDGLLAL